ncbi:hypothetical protein [Ageratum leaf curl Cameroon virus]|uniref:C4 protein n=4 Tax=Begomovirus TaxID=10814 RepID=F8LG83_9GEMI|nr:hypothetical protein [Ageratum leaf curl Cameroon virus]CBX51442.1 hypothetical protein [Ageratum leaf curl Cameroon virus]CCC14813.1 C4 protein [Ageratum leaf curl Cameroon virus [CM:AGFG24:2009]]CCC14819.1 C4 protein [Ageratum leaf curl Cameroon virus [CM:AGFG14:2009]]CCC14825.1 C4 protein [Ageratum leaf curl Cameroon virus [CM:AGFG23:2009]]
MANLISMCLCNSKGSTSARISDSSTSYPLTGQHISIRTYRELNPAPMSSPTSTRTATPSNGENFKSMQDLQEEANKQPMMLTPEQLTQEVNKRLLIYLRN